MGVIWKAQSNEIYQSWVDSILNESSESLSDWERNFLDSIQVHLNNKRVLTQRQAETLERIYTEKTS